MPELPEVETTVRGLARHLESRIITSVRIARPDMRRPFPDGLGQALVGARVTGLGRRAKFGLLHTDRDQTLIFHLGMSGRWRIDPEQPDRHDHLTIETDTNRFALNDPRRFGWVDLVDTDVVESWPSFAAMGPEPLGPELTPEYLRRALAGRKQAIKLLLLDQRIVAGLGNIYVCEALWRARISPKRAGGRISLGTDWPAAGYFSTYKPLDSIQIGVTRQLIGEPGAAVLAPADQRLSVEQAVHANTLGAAYQIRMDDRVGSLEAGKLADLIVLDRNIFDIDPHDIHRAQVQLTMMNGRVVHEV